MDKYAFFFVAKIRQVYKNAEKQTNSAQKHLTRHIFVV